MIPTVQYQRELRDLSLKQQIRLAVLRACLDVRSQESLLFGSVIDRVWKELLPWMDYSGLALYFFDKVCEQKAENLLPPSVFARLQGNLTDNRVRTKAMISELAELSSQFEVKGLSYAALKGLTLWPSSVPKPWLRSQADIDFLIAERDAPEARRILEHRGFHLHAISGRSWEFRTDQIHTATIKNMYRAVPFRCVELHLETHTSAQNSLLARTRLCRYEAVEVPGLAPVDLFLGQGLHLYKHVCSEFYRAAHLLEFHHHVRMRRDDQVFWRELQVLADTGSIAPLKLGVVNLIGERLLGPAAPEAFLQWTTERLPLEARLWVKRYGARMALGDVPGTKLYLLLQRAMSPAGIPAKRSTMRALLPSRIPKVTEAPLNESWSDRIHRYRLQIRFLHMRFRFHLIEGIRYLYEFTVWSRALSQMRSVQAFRISGSSKFSSTRIDRETRNSCNE